MSRSIPKKDKAACIVFAKDYGYLMPGSRFRLGDLAKKIKAYDPKAEGLAIAARYPNQMVRRANG